METWQLIVSVCAGVITVITFLDKVGITKTVKQADSDLKDVKNLLVNVAKMSGEIEAINILQPKQSEALLALLRNDLYRCFKENRSIAAWSDDECRVQTKLHEAYQGLGGNGEEDIWWEKKRQWKILSKEVIDEMRTDHTHEP